MKYFYYTLLIFPLCIQNSIAQSDLVPCSDPGKYIVEDLTQKSTYKNCQRNGMTYWYNDKGKIKSAVNFKDGKENGTYISYYDNGKKKLIVDFVDGQKNGLQQMFYDNGQLGSEVNYVMGKREGIMTDWDEEGYKSSEVFYKNNYKVGIKKYFDHKGNVIQTEEYKMDRNPVMLKLLKDKRKEIMIDLSKYGLMPENAPEEERVR
ncbi:toxin-antitoxin system YwqK family antitoxin [Sulfurovum sp. zt1-1]|uniref:Toxin-antitoxin system YwqK family antitoxin n=1 Tax=Sulfurovum zhangzhouensis TaxID=3019067 RepID=A0ABT7QYE9_9BACT|nr:toxin-antitoxin system YwqK family antitoxin [Sulfurovum zhangzhouensis]MDM5271859.1 toxin-antitoxin system YwqK family antitoxin [Sulfurovum zhangzhouensis]